MNMQNDGFTKDVMDMGDIAAKWRSFGWDTYEVDGHDINQLITTLRKTSEERPKVIICNTIKGKGVSFMELNIKFHGGCPTEAEYEAAIKELSE